ncbi:MAG TPA: hypothetical protein VHO71_02560 [Caproiciproducens sp.]|nr:hypothetical protein [Caproiciproducens sp.]
MSANFPGPYGFSEISPEKLKVIQQAENRLNESSDHKIVLIAYDRNQGSDSCVAKTHDFE